MLYAQNYSETMFWDFCYQLGSLYMYRLWCSTLIQTASSTFESCLNTQLKHSILAGPFGLLLSKPYTLTGSTISPFLMMTNQMTVSDQGQLIVKQSKNKLVSKQLSTLRLERKQELRDQLKLGKPIEIRSYSSSPFWHHRKGWRGRELKSSVDAIITKAVMREVTVIHSSIWYSNDIGHPSHAQTNNKCNKQSYSINALTIQKQP